MRNRLNDLDSKSYMKFLKSWSLFNKKTLSDFIMFFTKQEDTSAQISRVGIWGFNPQDKSELLKTGRHIIDMDSDLSKTLSYALIDLRNQTFYSESEVFIFFKEYLDDLLKNLRKHLVEKSYITLLCSNSKKEHFFFPMAWKIAKLVGQYFEMKDEKLLCDAAGQNTSVYFPVVGDKIIFALNFRNTFSKLQTNRSVFISSQFYDPANIRPWFILKPPPRTEKVKLHPAKFPEVLIEEYIKCFSSEGDNIFDPMSGTGSTQIAALTLGRNAYGCEVTAHFQNIAMERISRLSSELDYYIARDDAYCFDNHNQFPAVFDYIITSPPYWDMLNMDGAETQKTRMLQGLRTNYSAMDTDLGNCAEYDIFLAKLMKIYNKVLIRLKQGGCFTIIVKNIKKKGSVYTFAWDLLEKLSQNLSLTHISYWLQDDIRIAPYGYGNAWVSNTFHQYCLTFKKTQVSTTPK
jgi:DNA modification methylase